MTDESLPADTSTPETTADAVATEVKTPESAPVAPVSDNVQKRIDKLTWEKRELERRLSALEKPPEPKKELVAPKLEDSGYDEAKHQKAMAEYQELVIAQKAEEAAKRLLEQRDAEAKAKSRDESFAVEFKKLPPNEQEVANRALVSPFGAELIKESPVGPRIAVYLGENPDLAESIALLPERLQAKELGKLEAKLEAKIEAAKEPKVSSAPPPVPKIEATAPGIEKDPEKMSMNEWIKWREKSLRKKG